jgi:DNA/RNA-binding domain of Phe-tRNA-synthetase-like protein
MTDEPDVRRGLVATELAAEHPGLWVAWTDVAAAPARTPPELRDRLRALADRMRGPQAIALRSRDVPHAYRVFFRHVGLDPDVVRTPVEQVAVRRMADGGLHPRGLVDDALTIAVLETGVGVSAFDADRVVGAPALRLEAAGTIVLADEEGPLAALFGEPHERAAVTPRTRRIALVAVAVPNVPDVFVEEALWIAWDILRAPACSDP